MDDRHPRAGRQQRAAYLLLLAAESAAASLIFRSVFPLFELVLARSGQPQRLDGATAAEALAAALALQLCYWIRYRRIPVPDLLRSALLGHLLQFAGRASFIFASALFSAIFFRHLPQLGALPPLGQGIAKAFGLMAILFSLFCYSLELDRLGRAIEPPPAA